jgi:AcrR family transcriptional regulator
VPTGFALRDAREQLFGAAERVLLRDGPGALTSRAVTTELGVAKGVLHRHFADFDTFLAELVRDRIARLARYGEDLRDSAGRGALPDASAVEEVVASIVVGAEPGRSGGPWERG